jgi:hypothetical protein
MRKFIFVLIITLTLLVIGLTYATTEHCYTFGANTKCSQGVDIWLSKGNYRGSVDYICGTGEEHWDEQNINECNRWPSPTFPASGFYDSVREDHAKCPARGCHFQLGKVCLLCDTHADNFKNLDRDGNEGGFRYAYPKQCWITPDEDFQLSREISINAKGYKPAEKICETSKCAVEVKSKVINIERGGVTEQKELPYQAVSAYSAKGSHLVVCPANKEKVSITLNLPPSITKSIGSDITVYRSQYRYEPPGDDSCPRGSEKIDAWCDDQIVPKEGETKYRDHTFVLTLEINSCPPAADPNKTYAVPDGSGCTECIVDSDCGSNVCDYKNDYAEIFFCDGTSDDDPDNGATYRNNVCKVDAHKIEDDPKGCTYACGDHWASPGEKTKFGNYTQSEVDSKTPKCCGNAFDGYSGNTPFGPQEFFNRRKCIGCPQDPNDNACCDASTDCIYNGKCYDQISFVFEQDFQAVCAGGTWLGTKPKLLYGRTTYTDLPMCGDLICDLLSGEDCWSCPTEYRQLLKYTSKYIRINILYGNVRH